MAPNLITILGTLQFIIVHIVIVYHTGIDLYGDVPSWVWYLNAFSLFFYSVMDNCDGKQARKTNSSSPMGMLFDHGCDAVVTWVLLLSSLAQFKTQNAFLMLLTLLIVGQVSFYLAMAANYVTGTFKLGRVNAVDEGIPVLIIMFIFTGIVGQDFYLKKGLLDFTIGENIMFFSIVSALIQTFMFFYDCLEGLQQETCKQLYRIFFVQLVYSVLFVLLYFYSPTNITQTSIALIGYATSFIYCKQIGHIQVCHFSNEQFKQWNMSMIILLLVYVFNLAVNNQKYLVDEFYLFLGLAIYGLLHYLHFFMNVFRQVSNLLNIRIFCINNNNQHKKLTQQ